MESLIRLSKIKPLTRIWLIFGLCVTVTIPFIVALNIEPRSYAKNESPSESDIAGAESDQPAGDTSEPGESENEIADLSFNEYESEEYVPEQTHTSTSSSTSDSSSSGSETADIVLTDSKYTESNYLYYPINKKYALPKGFAPSGLVSLSGYDIPRMSNNTYYLKSNAADALEQLVADFEAAGYSGAVRSAYRSESTQESTFNSWVSKEQAKGYSYSEAVARASAYSARPRHSEHQLGTAVDFVLPRLDYAFTQNMWGSPEENWIVANAHKYGFVVSYPQNREEITGYIAEPWHLRYIGVSFATALYNQGYLNSGSQTSAFTYLINRY